MPRYGPSTYRDVSPTAVLRAIAAGDGALPDVFEDDPGLAESLRLASGSEKAFGHKVAESARLLRDWCEELDSWEWTGISDGFSTLAEFPKGEKDKEKATHALPTDHGHLGDDVASLGSNPARRFIHFEQRMHSISTELATFDMEQQKSLVLNAHSQPGTVKSHGDDTVGSQERPHLDGLTALITATILTSLPRYAHLISLLDVWSARISVVQIIPRFLSNLKTTQVDLDAAWGLIAMSEDDTSLALREHPGELTQEALQRSKFEKTRELLAQSLAVLGKDLDVMLDALEAHEDTLPDDWIDEFENLEERFSHWVVEAEAAVSRAERLTLLKKTTVEDRTHPSEPQISSENSSELTLRMASKPDTEHIGPSVLASGKMIPPIMDSIDHAAASTGSSYEARDRSWIADSQNVIAKSQGVVQNEKFEETKGVEPSRHFVDNGNSHAMDRAVGEDLPSIGNKGFESTAATFDPIAHSQTSLLTSTGGSIYPATHNLLSTIENEQINPPMIEREHESGLDEGQGQSLQPQDLQLWDPSALLATIPPFANGGSQTDAFASFGGHKTFGIQRQKGMFFNGPSDKGSMHRRNSSHEITLHKAAFAALHSMSEVKRVDIERPAATGRILHRRRSSAARLGQSTDNSRHKITRSEAWPKGKHFDYAPEPFPLSMSPTVGDTWMSSKVFGSAPSTQQGTLLSDDAESDGARQHVAPFLSEENGVADNRSNVDSSFFSADDEEDYLDVGNEEVDDGLETNIPSFHQESSISHVKIPVTPSDDKLERRIDKILHSLPTHISFNKRGFNPSRNAPGADDGSRQYLEQGAPQSKSLERSQTPALTLSEAEHPESRPTRFKSGDSAIRLYHLMQTGRHAPIKLYVRLVGEDGERVMVRVGGGWADLAEYLRDYASHHSRAIVPESGKSLQTVDHTSPGNTRAFSMPALLNERKVSPASTPPNAPSSRAASRLANVPEAGQNLQLSKTRSQGAKSQRSVSFQPISVQREDSSDRDVEQEGNSEDDGGSPTISARSKLTAEKKQWLDSMVAKARKWKADGGSSAGNGADASIVGKTRRVYRTSDGSIRELGK